MSALSDIAKSLWAKVVATEQAVPVIQAVISGVKDTALGKSPSVLASIGQNYPEVLQVIEALAQQAGTFVGGPLGGFAAKEFVEILAEGHKMSADEEEAWFARQSSEAGSG